MPEHERSEFAFSIRRPRALLAGRVLLLCLLLSHTRTAYSQDEGGRERDSSINKEYMSQETSVRQTDRQMCTGFGQLETLKGEWVRHPDYSYRGISDPSMCPEFIADFDCRADSIDKKYERQAEKEYRKTFEPHACELNAFDASDFSQCMAGQRLIIIGDSTMRQVFQSLACLLHEEVSSGWFVDWDKANSSQTSIAFERQYTLSDDPQTNVLKQNVGMFTLKSGAEVHIQSFGIFNLTLWDDVMAQFGPLSENDTIVVEFGAWYPRFNMWTVRKPWDRYLADIWVLFEERLRHTDAKVLWRSYGPTHFGERSTGTFLALSGVLGDLPTRETCEPVDYGEYYYDTEIIKYLEGHCKEDCAHIHILPVYHLSLGAHNSHHGSFGRGISDGQIDCRHYCSNIIDTWSQVLYNKMCF